LCVTTGSRLLCIRDKLWWITVHDRK
jgi:hypothetical protein